MPVISPNITSLNPFDICSTLPETTDGIPAMEELEGICGVRDGGEKNKLRENKPNARSYQREHK